MEKDLIGHANHIYSQSEMTALRVETIDIEKENDIPPYITIVDTGAHDADGYHQRISISSKEQLNQLKVLLNMAEDALEWE